MQNTCAFIETIHNLDSKNLSCWVQIWIHSKILRLGNSSKISYDEVVSNIITTVYETATVDPV